MKKHLIYAYKKNDNNKIVYVGQTDNLQRRNEQHIKYDPFNVNAKEYNYPLSRGIRKYGEEAYSLIILEDNINSENINEKERYWIKYYDTYFNGYNQTIGGSNPTQTIFTDDKIDLVIEMLKNQEYSYKDIFEKTGISLTHIHNINIGKRRKKDNLIYPIRPSNAKGSKGLKFSLEECKKIHEEILKNNKTFKELSKIFNCSPSVISDINKGVRKNYRLKEYQYPLRDSKKTSKKIYWDEKKGE